MFLLCFFFFIYSSKQYIYIKYETLSTLLFRFGNECLERCAVFANFIWKLENNFTPDTCDLSAIYLCPALSAGRPAQVGNHCSTVNYYVQVCASRSTRVRGTPSCSWQTRHDSVTRRRPTFCLGVGTSNVRKVNARSVCAQEDIMQNTMQTKQIRIRTGLGRDTIRTRLLSWRLPRTMSRLYSVRIVFYILEWRSWWTFLSLCLSTIQ